MKIRTAVYLLKQGLRGLWRNRIMGIVSIFSIACVLIILGIVFILILNINNLAESAKSQFDSVQVYLRDDLQPDRIEEIGEEIEKIEGIQSIYFLSKEEALERMKEDWGENGYLLEELETNPLPNSYVVKLKAIENAEQVVRQIKKIQGLEEVKYYKDVMDKLLKITKFIRLTGTVIIAILIIISMVVVINTIKLTVIARRKEINIMKYVGATNWFIRWPFVVEGVFLGLFGAAIALGVLGLGYQKVFDLLTQKIYILLAPYMMPATLLMEDLLVIFVVLGAGIGALGSIFSMKKFLNV
ncbi:MAG TPA: ABC transporter permease [Clostridiales bacterium]|nr:ABC transporter permease [Clostridiales bacterium]